MYTIVSSTEVSEPKQRHPSARGLPAYEKTRLQPIISRYRKMPYAEQRFREVLDYWAKRGYTIKWYGLHDAVFVKESASGRRSVTVVSLRVGDFDDSWLDNMHSYPLV